jgi:hypothetical protein
MTSARSRTFLKLCAWSAVLCLVGAWIARGAGIFGPATDPTVPHATNFYLYTFVRFEPLALYASAAFFFVLYLVFAKTKPAPESPGLLASPWIPFSAAVAVLVAVSIGRFAIYQNFDLCIDEYLNDFEVKILDQHHLLATVPAEWRDFAPAMRVAYQNYHPDSGTWASGFLPGFASLQFVFSQAGIDWALSPVLAAVSLLLLAAIARRIFPERPALAANVAVLLLAASPQFLAMAMTKFAWTAQLCGSLLWVWLLIHPKRIVFMLTPILGALLIGLHQPHVHPLVAAPFVLRFLFTRQWKIFAWFAAWYLAGAFAWFQVYEMLRPGALVAGGDLSNMMQPTSAPFMPLVLSAIFATFHAVTLLGWVTPVAVPLLGIFLLTWKEQPAIARDGFLAAALTFAFYLFFPHPQGHGWGFRYLHAAYGLLALAAAGGAMALVREGGSSRWSWALIASVLFSLVIQIPYRSHEITALVRPLSLVSGFIARLKADFVLIKTEDFWYAQDLIRNDPWLEEKPFVFDADKLTPEQIAQLKGRGTVVVIGSDDVKEFGVILSDPKKPPAP